MIETKSMIDELRTGHFLLTGENLESKLKNYIITKFPEGIMEVNGVLTAFSTQYTLRASETILSTLHVQFCFEGNKATALLHISCGGSFRWPNLKAHDKQV